MWNFAQQLEVHAENQALAMSPPSDSFFERDDVMTSKLQCLLVASGKTNIMTGIIMSRNAVK